MSKALGELEHVDAVIVGGNIRGLLAAHVLSSLGYRAVLLEKAATVGGVDKSFVTPDGTTFDIGLHVLDYMRSEVATRMFSYATDGEFHKVKLKRGVVLRNQIMPYAAEREDLPEEFRAMLPEGEIIDDLGDDIPTRKRIGEIYGPAFADVVFDEILPSYRCENRHRQFGVDESLLMQNVYPWLFPKATRAAKNFDESRTFHDQLRNTAEQWIQYPKKGGFGGFAQRVVRQVQQRSHRSADRYRRYQRRSRARHASGQMDQRRRSALRRQVLFLGGALADIVQSAGHSVPGHRRRSRAARELSPEQVGDLRLSRVARRRSQAALQSGVLSFEFSRGRRASDAGRTRVSQGG